MSLPPLPLRHWLFAPLVLLPLLTGACAPGPAQTSPQPANGPAASPAALARLELPPVPPVRGAPLAVRVQYPGEGQVVTSRDSNFILGAVGSGDAALTINGVAVPVAPNGAFIGWLGNPPAAAPIYELVATRGADTARRTLRIRYPARTPLLATGPLRVDSGSVTPGARTRAAGTEFLRVTLRAPGNAAAWLETADGARRTMPPLQRGPVVLPANPADDAAITFATDVPARLITAATRVVAARGADTVRLPIAAVELTNPDVRLLGALRTSITVGSDSDRTVNARTIPDGTYKWLLLPGTIVEVTGRQGAFTRVRLDETLDVWVDNNDIALLPEGTARARRVTSGLRVIDAPEWSDLVISTGERPAFLVEPDGNRIVLTLYGVQANPEISPIAQNGVIRRVSWDQVTSDRVRVTLVLDREAYGWLSLWDDARRAFVLRVRRPPVIANSARPLQGLTIAVDPGHPPAGSTGPTGLFEGDAVLPVGVLIKSMLEQRGATVVLTRTTRDALGLTERAIVSRRANAHAFVSIHLNAFPDGVNPFTNNGTSTLFFNQPSEPLARAIQREILPRLGLRDLGVHYQNLAVARPSWYPSALTEGAFVIIPEQEAAMRNPVYQQRYAEGIVVGLENYFRGLAGR